MKSSNPTVERLDDQIKWYDKKSMTNQRRFKELKVAQIVTAALIPFVANLSLPTYVVASLGVVVVALEGIQSLNQYQENWISYRSTCEALKHERFLWLAQAGPYRNSQNPDVTLAERVESLISREHAKWVSEWEKPTEKREADPRTPA